jgi:multicomponent Na+:H+ antiporter subunit D
VSEWSHPAWPLLAGALLAAALPVAARRVVAVAAPLLALGLAWTLPDGEVGGRLLGLPLVWLRADALARVFAIVFALVTVLGAVYALATPRRLLLAPALAAAAAAEGIVLAGDWVTLYLAWETLAVASFVLVGDGGGRAWAPALRYLLVHAVGGALLLAGIVAHVTAGGSALVGAVAAAGPGALILLAFAVNAAIPPLHAWLTDAYPASSPAGTVFLSAFATKAAVYALARVFAGEEVLVWAGVAMALYGVVFAVLENDIRRLLGYHIVSQVGYMVAGIGLGTPMALSGAAAHAFCHILYKGLLMMGAGAVVHVTGGRRRLTELGGLAPAMPATVALYMVGALSISGAPLLNGFVSKSLVVAAAEAEHRGVVVALLTLASVGTFLHTGLKLPWFTFGAGAGASVTPAPVPAPMLVAMAAAAGLCALTGMAPRLLYALLPFPVDWEPYTAGHVLEVVQLLAGTLVGFLLLLRNLAGEPTVTLDAHLLYRALGRLVTTRLAPALARAADLAESASYALATLPPTLDRTRLQPIGYTILLATATLSLALLLLQ